MRTLDCETPESAFASVANIFGISPALLETFLDELEPSDWDAEEPALYPSQVIQRLQEKTGKECSFSATYWFHFTRTLRTNEFENGILPLGESIDSLWQSLFGLLEGNLTKAEWNDFRQHVESDSQSCSARLYRHKLQDSGQWGPYALLIREFGLEAQELGNPDWLSSPEIVEDICLCFEERYGSSHLMHRFQESTSPCIVKFVEHRADQANLQTALYYLYNKHYDHDWSQELGDTFSGGGKPVPASKICKIEFLPDRS
jgi:hypothetical protein